MRYYKTVIVLLFSTFILNGLSAQSPAEGESLFNSRQYAKAKTVYEALLKRNPKDALNNYRLARCCYELKEYEKAVTHFEVSGTRYPLTPLYLGESYFYAYRFEESIAAYQSYIASLKPDDKMILELEMKIQTSELGVRLINRIEDIAIIDSMVVNKNEFLRFYKHSKEIGSITQERIRTSTNQVHDKISYTTERGDRLCFSDSMNGKMNIFSSFKLMDEWSKPISISSNINSKANENYPFFMLDGLTLYYASDGENSLGGYDIFYTRYSSAGKDYLNPENAGFPFNSPWNDYMMVIDDIQKIGWFASDRYQSAGKLIIYKFELNDPKIYFRSEDPAQTIQVAKLEKSRKANKNKYKNVNEPVEVELIPKEDDLFIVINDSTVYTHFDQFQNTKGLQNIKEWLQLSERQKALKTELENLRESYALSETAEQTIQLSELIRQKEHSLILNEEKLKNKYKEATNEEIKFIDKN